MLRKLGFLIGLLLWPSLFLRGETLDDMVFLGDKDYPPITFLENGIPKGLFVDVAEAIGELTGRPIQIQLKDWKKAQEEALESGSGILMALSSNKEREELFDFSQFIYKNEFTFFFLETTPGIASLSDLPGKSIAVTSGGLPRRVIEPLAGVRTLPVGTYHEAFELVLDGKADAFAADKWVGSFIIQRDGLRGLSLAEVPFTQLQAGFATPKGNRAALETIDLALNALRENGKLENLLSKWQPKRILFFSKEQLESYLLGAGIVLTLFLTLFLSGWVIFLKRTINQRRRAEERSLKWAQIFEHAGWGVAVSDPSGERLELINPAYARMHGYEVDELIGTPIKSLFTPDFHGKIPEYVRMAKERGQVEFESFHIRKDGSSFPVQINLNSVQDKKGQTVNLAVNLQDITQRRQSEEALGREKERLAVTLRSIGDGVIATDLEAKVTVMNKVAEHLTGWTFEKARGKPFSEIYRTISTDGGLPRPDPVQRILTHKSFETLQAPLLLLDAHGAKKLITDSSAPIHDGESRVVGVVVVFRDVTDREKTEILLKNTQKLESLGVMAGGIAHDFNNLLTGIFGNIDQALILLEKRSFEKLEESLRRVQGVLGRARQLTQQLLTFSKGGDPIRRPHPINELVKRTVRFALSGSNVSCTFEEAGELLCEIDEHQIAQVIDNIVINAKQAMENGGRLEVRIGKIGTHDRPAVLTDADFAEISFRDYGPGIPHAIQSKIFDPFFTTKSKGSGLGLATSFSIVKKHNGVIFAESEPGRGATFRLFLPVCGDVGTPSPEKPVPRFQGSGRVLVMDDDPTVLDILENMLHEMGLEVTRASGGDQALNILSEELARQKKFDAAIFDLTIPGGRGGQEIMEEARALDPDLKVLATSGYSEGPVMADPLSHGFLASLSKPFALKDLARVFHKLFPDSTAPSPPTTGEEDA